MRKLDPNDIRERKTEMAKAALVVIAREGIEGLSFRSLSVESERSIGAIQKIFASKDELLESVLDEVAAVARGHLADDAKFTSAREFCEAFARQLLPLDGDARSAALVALALLARAPYDENVARAFRDRDQQLLEELTMVLHGFLGLASGASTANHDARSIARVFLATIDGLALQMLSGAVNADDALQAIRVLLDEHIPQD